MRFLAVFDYVWLASFVTVFCIEYGALVAQNQRFTLGIDFVLHRSFGLFDIIAVEMQRVLECCKTPCFDPEHPRDSRIRIVAPTTVPIDIVYEACHGTCEGTTSASSVVSPPMSKLLKLNIQLGTSGVE